MSERPIWSDWLDLDERARGMAIRDADFWSQLTDLQRQSFLGRAEWQELRLVPEARQAKLAGLVSLEEITANLGLTDVKVYWLMSTRKLPGWLVEGAWKFDLGQVGHWVEQMGGLARVREDVEQQIAEHKAAQSGASDQHGSERSEPPTTKADH